VRFLPCTIPSANRVHKELDRYVRSEYRESSSGWFAADCRDMTGMKIMAEEKPIVLTSSSTPEITSSASSRPTNCPVLNAIAESRLVKELSPRSELSGRE
jgi:hypothetical protein